MTLWIGTELADDKREYRSNRLDWGSIRKRGKKYQASYVVDGLRYYAPLTYTTETDAKAWLVQRRAEVQTGTWKPPKSLAAETFGKYAATWVSQRNVRPKTRQEYERQLKTGLSPFAKDRITAITGARVREWHAGRRAQSGATMAGSEARLLRAILNTAIIDGIITTNPVPGVLTRTASGVKHRPPTMDELGVILDEIGPFFRLAVLLAAYGGLRFGEWRALRCRDMLEGDGRVLVTVDRAAQYITGQGWHVGPPKSQDGVRVVPLPKGLTADVERHLDAFVGPFPDDLIFPPARGSGFVHDRQFNRDWNRARDAAGIRDVVREHDLRAFAGTMHAQSGATLRETMAFLGHSTTVAAMAYQATTGRDAELADRMPLPQQTPRKVKTIGGK